MAERIQLRRTKGWRMPPGAVKVDRSTRWGNPFRVNDTPGRHGIQNASEAVELYREWLLGHPNSGGPSLLGDARRELRGKDLACWCKPDDPCHADVLLDLVNQ